MKKILLICSFITIIGGAFAQKNHEVKAQEQTKEIEIYFSSLNQSLDGLQLNEINNINLVFAEKIASIEALSDLHPEQRKEMIFDRNIERLDAISKKLKKEQIEKFTSYRDLKK